MNALEIKPGKYRTRGGYIVCVDSDQKRPGMFLGMVGGILFDWHGNGRANAFREMQADLIERIEDEPKAEEKCQQKFPLRFAVSGMDAASVGDDQTCVVTAASSRENLVDETLKQFTAEFLSLGWRAKVAALEAKIARLEAENESLSRQLRSRALNSEPASAGKVWRWSPMV